MCLKKGQDKVKTNKENKRNEKQFKGEDIKNKLTSGLCSKQEKYRNSLDFSIEQKSLNTSASRYEL